MNYWEKMEEPELVKLAIKGDHTAMAELYRRNKERVFKLAFHYVGNIQDAEDLLQDIFTKAFLSLKKKFQPQADARFSTWLYRVGINHCLSYLRKNKKYILTHQQATATATSSLDRIDTEDSGPEEMALNKDIRERVNACLKGLSVKQRMIFILRFYEGYKVKEIAKHLNCSEGNIKTQLFRAVVKVRKKIKLLP
jgi:RNA polymerase sigma-70 factor (ECF subfamily)